MPIAAVLIPGEPHGGGSSTMVILLPCKPPPTPADLRSPCSMTNLGRPSPAPPPAPRHALSPAHPRGVLCSSPSSLHTRPFGARSRCPPEARGRRRGGGRRRAEPPLRRARSYKCGVERSGEQREPWVTVSPAGISSGSTRSSPTRSAGRRSWVSGGAGERPPSGRAPGLDRTPGRGGAGGARGSVPAPPMSPLGAARGTARAAGSGGSASEGYFSGGGVGTTTDTHALPNSPGAASPSRGGSGGARGGEGAPAAEESPAAPGWVTRAAEPAVAG